MTAAERARDGDLVDEVKTVVEPNDPILHYSMLGNVFLGTMLPNYLTAWGVRTLLIPGYHRIEQAARTARDLGYMPIVAGDPCGCGRIVDEAPMLERLNSFFAPVMSTGQVITLLLP